MKKYFITNCLKSKIGFLLILFAFFAQESFAQPATVSIPVGIGAPCDRNSNKAWDSLKYFNFNGNINELSTRSICDPILSTLAPWPGFSSIFASITFNPYDQYLYFTQIAKVSGKWNSYTYRWSPLVCPDSVANVPVYQTFLNQFVAGVEFDAATGLAYQINFTGAAAPYSMELQQVNFATGTLGASIPIDFGGRFIHQQSGDVVMTPGGQMLAIFDNKYFTVNWKDYGINPLVATYIDTLNFGGSRRLVGLSYSAGKLIGSITGSCPTYYRQIDILTGAQSPISYNAPAANNGNKIFNSNDMTNLPSGIGAAKNLVSVTENPVGSKIYDVFYDIKIKNYGGSPVTDVQVFDTLNKINGFANNVSGSIVSIIGPAGISANPAFNGKTNFALLVPGSTLSNIPGQNTIDIRIACRVANVQPGIIYYNQAVVTGVGLLGDPLRDSSTNGTNPDLNLNDKPDDVGESQPTPFLVSVAAVTPPCATLTKILYTQTFGAGTANVTPIPSASLGTGVVFGAAGTSYTGSTVAPIALERYMLTDTARRADTANFLPLRDHTGNANGRMLLVNADANNTTIYRGSVVMLGSLCSNQQYSLSFYAAFIGNSRYQTLCNAFGGFTYPKIKMRIRDAFAAGNPIITEISTSNITNTSWQQYGLKFVSPGSYSGIIFELINDAPGGCGNDVAIDDIQFGSCDPTPTVSIDAATGGCLGYTTVFSTTLSDPAAIPGTKDYQWQVYTNPSGPWVDIPGETNATYTILSVGVGHINKLYRVKVAATGNLGNPSCEYISPSILLTGKTPSVAPTAATKNKNNICPGIVVSLGITGGTLGTNATWRWYSGTCGGTFIGTGASINVSPSVTTTYFVRAEGDCNTTNCQQVTVNISCDLDKDKDGIPDWVESYTFPAALTNAFNTGYAGYVDNNFDYVNDNFQADGDSDNDGIPNYLDTNFPGRIDSNGDGVDDRFDFDKDGIINMLDLDSDNDGIPDVVEAGGIDANGDGKLDNFSDTDNDGISQNVDANNTGVVNSGNGLGAVNLDNDSNPNAIDLDSDNDGIPDVVEAEGPDTNNDGKIDGFVDANSDGLHDSYINATGLLRTGADVNNDGRADSYPFKNFDNDGRPNCYDIDSDADGITDVREAGFTDGIAGVGADGFIDGAIGTNGWSTVVSALPALNLTNTDGRSRPNYMDIDSDDDGIPDNVEAMSTATYKLPTGVDSDNDGLDNAYEPFGPFTSVFGGPGIYPNDHDFDNIPDYMDLDTDSDGALDITEGHDYNGNGIADDGAVLSGNDADGDGLDDTFDALNSTTDIYGTSAFMGNGGTFSGDPTPGSKCSVQKFNPAQTDRDWRYTMYVLDVQLLSFNAILQNNTTLLNWSLISTDQIQHFEIERSLNNQNFVSIQQLQKNVPLRSVANYFTTDNLEFVDATEVYYRLKIVAANGQVKYSSVVVVRLSKKQNYQFSIHPNPAKNLVITSFVAKVDAEVTIKILDNLGKTVLTHKQFVTKGNNKITLQGLSKFANAGYSLQVVMPNEILTQKLIINNP